MDLFFESVLFIEAENEEKMNEEAHLRNILRQERCLLRNKGTALNISDNRFVEIFRVSKAMFEYILTEIEPQIEFKRCSSVPLHIQLLTVLRMLAIGGYQRSVGEDLLLGLSQTSVSRIMAKILPILVSSLCAKWIKWPNSQQERDEIKAKFFSKYGYPSVIGIIDGTHIHMTAPQTDEHLYVNRKGVHSLNVQIICDSDLRILSIDANHPGSSHDASIWNTSNERQCLQTTYQQDKCWLLGDSGYPLEPWLITPFRNATPNSSEAKFNEKHSKIRVTIERCIGVLKNRWRVLMAERKLRYQPIQYVSIINVCAALHNLCLNFNVDYTNLSSDIFPEEMDEEESEITSDRLRVEGNINRQSLMNALRL